MASSAPLVRKPRRSVCLTLFVGCALVAALHIAVFQNPEAPRSNESKELGNPLVATVSVAAAVAAAATIPQLMKRNKMRMNRNRRASYRSNDAPETMPAGGPKSTPDPRLQQRIGKLVMLNLPNSKDGIICRLLKTTSLPQTPNFQYAVLSIENGKHGTEVACTNVRDMAMRTQFNEGIMQLQQQIKMRGGRPMTTAQLAQIQAIKTEAVQAAMNCISNGTFEGVSHMVGPNASVITVRPELLSYPEEELLNLFDVVNRGDFSAFKDLQAQGKVPLDVVDSSGRSLLYVACREGQTKIAEALLDMGYAVDRMAANQATPMYVATQGNHTDIMKKLIAKGCDVNRKMNITYPFIAAQGGFVDALNLLIDAGADPSRPSMNGFSTLYIASQNGRKAVVERLLEFPQIKNNVNEGMVARQGATALYIAAQMGHSEICKLLIENGADVNKAMEEGSTPLKAAATKGDMDCIDLMLNKGADVNKKSDDGSTPLMFAVIKSNVIATMTLIQRGADITVKNKQGEDALSLATRAGHHEIVMILKKEYQKKGLTIPEYPGRATQ